MWPGIRPAGQILHEVPESPNPVGLKKHNLNKRLSWRYPQPCLTIYFDCHLKQVLQGFQATYCQKWLIYRLINMVTQRTAHLINHIYTEKDQKNKRRTEQDHCRMHTFRVCKIRQHQSKNKTNTCNLFGLHIFTPLSYKQPGAV